MSGGMIDEVIIFLEGMEKIIPSNLKRWQYNLKSTNLKRMCFYPVVKRMHVLSMVMFNKLLVPIGKNPSLSIQYLSLKFKNLPLKSKISQFGGPKIT